MLFCFSNGILNRRNSDVSRFRMSRIMACAVTEIRYFVMTVSIGNSHTFNIFGTILIASLTTRTAILLLLHQHSKHLMNVNTVILIY